MKPLRFRVVELTPPKGSSDNLMYVQRKYWWGWVNETQLAYGDSRLYGLRNTCTFLSLLDARVHITAVAEKHLLMKGKAKDNYLIASIHDNQSRLPVLEDIEIRFFKRKSL